LIGRPRHVVRTIDHMLMIWPAHESLDPTRIGGVLGRHPILYRAGIGSSGWIPDLRPPRGERLGRTDSGPSLPHLGVERSIHFQPFTPGA
jgi:hypothetical protein